MSNLLLKNTGIYVATSIASQGIVFLLWILLAWWLPPSEIGLYALALFSVELFTIAASLGLEATVMRFYYDTANVSSVLKNAVLILIASSVITLIIFLSGAQGDY